MHRGGGIKPPDILMAVVAGQWFIVPFAVEARPLAFALATDYSLFQFEVTIGSRSSINNKTSRAGIDPPSAAGGAQCGSGRVSRIRHVSHDGRGAAARACGGCLSGELVLGL